MVQNPHEAAGNYYCLLPPCNMRSMTSASCTVTNALARQMSSVDSLIHHEQSIDWVYLAQSTNLLAVHLASQRQGRLHSPPLLFPLPRLSASEDLTQCSIWLSQLWGLSLGDYPASYAFAGLSCRRHSVLGLSVRVRASVITLF